MNTIKNPHQLVTMGTEDFILAIKKDFKLDISDVQQIEHGYSSQVYKVLLNGKTVFIKINQNPDVFPVEVLGYQILKQQGIPVPDVITLQDHPQTIGYSTIILSSAEGIPLKDARLTPDQENTVFREMGAILKKIHEVKLEGFGRLVVKEGKLRGKFNSWNELKNYLENRYAEDAIKIKELELLTEKELEVFTAATKELGSVNIEHGSMLHRDVHKGHVFVMGDKITGLIDLGALEVGDPRFDIAMGMVFQNPLQQESFKCGYGELAYDPFVNKYLLCIAVRKIIFRINQGKMDGMEEAKEVFRRAASYSH